MSTIDSSDLALARQRFLATLDVVAREARHLDWSLRRLDGETIDAQWVSALESRPETAERLEAFVSRFGRLQDTIGDKLLPRWLTALAERPASLIENLQRAERLGVIDSAEQWLATRALRNRLVHEYMSDPEAFARALIMAQAQCAMLVQTYGRFRQEAQLRLGVPGDQLPS